MGVLSQEIPGKEHIISSDGFFELEALPASCAVIGAGYIAVEMAGILCALGSETSLLVRGDKALRAFDDLVADHLDFEMKRQGMVVVPKTTLASVTLDETTGLKTLTTTDGRTLGPRAPAARSSFSFSTFKVARGGDYLFLFVERTTRHRREASCCLERARLVSRLSSVFSRPPRDSFECVLAAVGRSPLTAPLALEKAGVSTKANGYISVDEYQATSAAQVYALGDVCGDVELTPMAIAAGRRLADRLFGDAPQSKADYSNVPTVVFSHPTIGTIGLTEAEAKAQFGDEAVTIYTTTFVNLWYGPMPIEPSTKPKSKMKLVCTGPEETVVGLHCIGMASDELLQGFGVAMKMKATKADFDSCIALHPTAAEEVVTMAPWGLSGLPHPSLFGDKRFFKRVCVQGQFLCQGETRHTRGLSFFSRAAVFRAPIRHLILPSRRRLRHARRLSVAGRDRLLGNKVDPRESTRVPDLLRSHDARANAADLDIVTR